MRRDKILDHRGITLNFPLGVLSQFGRAYSMQSDSAKARPAYKNFLTLWKDADPDIPILKQAKSEYAAVKRRANQQKLWPASMDIKIERFTPEQEA